VAGRYGRRRKHLLV